MRHEEIQDFLEGYVDETLDRETRRQVDAHLASCKECWAILEGIAPVELGAASGSWSEADMRRAVRRSLLRVAVDAVLLLIAATLIAWFLSLAVLHPFVINRGGRAEAATIATSDLAVMFNPGAGVTEHQHNARLLDRTIEVTVGRPLGNRIVELGELVTRLGPLGFGGRETGRVFPYLGDDPVGYGGKTQLKQVIEGTVATAELWYEDPLDLAAATELTRSNADVRIVWAGFAVGEGPAASGAASDLAPAGVIGYGTCDEGVFSGDLASAAGGGGNRTGFGLPTSIERALSEARRSLENLIRHPELLKGIGASVTGAGHVMSDLEEGEVRSLVVTGPTSEMLAFVNEASPDSTRVLDIDFINWSQPLCGR